MNTLQRILILSVLLISSISFSQTWQSVGPSPTNGTPAEMDFVIAETGEMYFFYKSAGSYIYVNKWNGTSWEIMGGFPVSTSVNTASDLRIETLSDGTPVISYKDTFVNDKIDVQYWNGTGWAYYGSTSFLADLGKPYDMSIGDDDQVSIVYYNLNPSCGPTNAYIWLDVNIGSQTQISGLITGNIFNTFSIGKSTVTNDYWELHGDFSGPNSAALGHAGTFAFVPAPGGAEMHSTYGITASQAEVRVVNGSEKFVAIYKEENGPNHTTFVRYYDIATDTYSSEFTLANGIIESDMAVTDDGHAFTMDEHGTYGMTKIDLSNMTGATYANAFTSTTAIDNPRVDTENGVLVVAWINESTNELEVWEEVITPTVTKYSDITVCNGTNYSSTDTIFTVSGNYNHSAEIYSVTSNNNAVINSGSITITGTYPNFSLQFPTAFVASDVVVELTVSAASSAGISTDVIYVNVTTPNIISSVPDSICKNTGPLLLNPLVTPSGGVWSGSNVSNNKFYMSSIAPGDYNLLYTYTDAQGCVGKDTSTITVLPVPNLTVTTTLATCSNNDGTATVNINSGDAISNYDVYWSNGQSDVSLIEDLAVGAYFVNVTDANNCTAVAQASINTNAYTVSEVVTQIDCFDDLDGAIDLTITGSTGPYTIVWSNGQTTEDLSNLGAGVYDVIITDINGCQAVHSYTIADPGEIFANITATSADCGLGNGSLETFPSGGTNPLLFQWFEGGGTYINNTNLISSLNGGSYYIVITDANGCTKLENVTLNENGGPVVVIDSVFHVTCVNPGSIYTTTTSSAAIQSTTWSNGATTDDITGLTTGFYSINVVDVNSCVGTASVLIGNAAPDDQVLCIVTVDSTTNTNRVVWEKPVSTDISHYNIYRETSTVGVYQFVDSVLYADESFFNDTIASPVVRSWRYKISAVDVCGTEGDLSPIHKTIHLTINVGLSGLINLAWDAYEGFPYGTFEIWRHTNPSGWVLIQSLPANTFAFSDVAPTPSGLGYIVIVNSPSQCTSTKATDYNSSRSNKNYSAVGGGIGFDELEQDFISIYPNPTSSLVTLYYPGIEEETLFQIIDSQGRIVLSESSSKSILDFDLSDFESGVYYLSFNTEKGKRIEMLIKQ